MSTLLLRFQTEFPRKTASFRWGRRLSQIQVASALLVLLAWHLRFGSAIGRLAMDETTARRFDEPASCCGKLSLVFQSGAEAKTLYCRHSATSLQELSRIEGPI